MLFCEVKQLDELINRGLRFSTEDIMAATADKKVKNPRQPMPEQDPKIRARNFLEVPTGYTMKMAQEEAARCLQCKKPGCVAGCPVGVDIPGFIDLIAQGDMTACHPQPLDQKCPAGCLRSGVSPGSPVRRKMYRRQKRRTGGHR